MQDTKESATAKLYQAISSGEWEEKEYIPMMQEVVTDTLFHAYSIDDEVLWLQMNSQVDYYRPILSNRIIGAILIIGRKIIRRLLAFLIHPITIEQSEYNAHMATTMRKMEIELYNQKSMIEDLSELTEQLKRKLEEKNSESLSGN